MTTALVAVTVEHEPPQWSRPMVGRMISPRAVTSTLATVPQWSRPIVDRMSCLVARAGEVERLTAMEPTIKWPDDRGSAVSWGHAVLAAMEPTSGRPDGGSSKVAREQSKYSSAREPLVVCTRVPLFRFQESKYCELPVCERRT